MIFTRYYGQFQDLRGSFGGLPPWARTIVSIVAIPGIILILLSILAFIVSVSALLLLTVPVYSLLRNLTGGSPGVMPQSQDVGGGGVKRVEATVVNDRPV